MSVINRVQSAQDLVVSLAADADEPLTLNDIRYHLRTNGKMANPSMEVQRLVDKGYMKKNEDGTFVIGERASGRNKDVQQVTKIVRLVRELLGCVSKEDAHKLIDSW